jgi:hypothetical protein
MVNWRLWVLVGCAVNLKIVFGCDPLGWGVLFGLSLER